MATDTQKQKQLKESMLSAINTLINQAVSTREWDQTLLGTINACKSALTGEYSVTCNGGKISAFTRDGEEYKPNELVYISIPQGNFNNKKFILGKASSQGRDGNITFVNSLLNSYNMIGRNLFDNESKLWLNTNHGLNSFKAKDGGFIYYYVEDWERSDETLSVLISQIDELNNQNKMLTFNQEEFRNYMNSAEALLIEGTFQTRLNKAHRSSADGHYGIAYTLAFKNKNVATKSSWQDYEENDIEYRTYLLDSSKMLGNPLRYESAIDQSAIFDFDKDNFLFLKSVEVYSEGFESSDNTSMITLWGNDIFITMPEIYGLRTITATNGDYTLRLSTPQGATFRTNSATEVLTAQANVTYKTMDISDQTTYYWFLKDNRVTAADEGYHVYGGSGWYYLKEKNTNYILSTNGYENKAYDNQYLIVGVYKQSVVLKQEFSLYNEANARDIIIESDLGNMFSFDRGEPILTCKIKNKDDEDYREENFDDTGTYPDSYYSFYWAISTPDGMTTSFLHDADELKEQLSNLKLGTASFSEISSLKQQLASVEGVIFSKGIHGNKIQYPVRKIATALTVNCSVFRKESATGTEYPIGSASLFLVNEDSATLNYSIVIVNGNQHFQYDEYGTAPTSEKNLNPQEILPLSVRFFDPTGAEVDKGTYSLKWKVPLGDSMIFIPGTMHLSPNAANNYIEEFYIADIFPLQIEDYFNYETISNSQVTAIVTYDGKTYEQDSNLWFDKVGDNGTNGTDISVKVAFDKGILDDKYMLGIKTIRFENPIWNTGKQFAQTPLKLQVFQRGELLENNETFWEIAGSGNTDNGKYYRIVDHSTPVISFRNKVGTNIQNNLIVRGQERRDIDSNNYEYYGFMGIPLVNILDNNDTRNIFFNKRYCLQEVTYNAAGQYPRYDKNAGLSIALQNAGQYVRLTVEGGRNNESSTANFGLYQYKDGKIINEDGTSTKETLWKDKPLIGKATYNSKTRMYEYMCYILPDDVFDGEWYDNVIHGKVYSSKSNADNDRGALAEFYYPIYMHLNTFGLKSLNAWDGNRIEINEDDNYILAPQIGAGEKDSNNRFTGIVMGTAQDYNQTQKQDTTAMVGLLGYSKGKQSIWLDAETGNAIFGLPETNASSNNKYTEGQIKLVPGGESTISRWHIGSRSLYNVTDGQIQEGQYRTVSTGLSTQSTLIIPPQNQGILLNADPAYISVKGMPLTRYNANIKWDDANTTIKPGDSIEVELDPNKHSPFTIFRHYQDGGRWVRRAMVGINANGQFYSNSVENDNATMALGWVGAFGSSAGDERYVGTVFTQAGGNIFKAFLDYNNGTSSNSPLYISTGTSVGSEYPRPIQIYGKDVILYAGSGTEKTSLYNLKISSSEISLNNKDDNIKLTSSSTEINNSSKIDLNVGKDSNATHVNMTNNSLMLKTFGDFKVEGKNISLDSSSSWKATGTKINLQTTNGYQLELSNSDGRIYNSSNSERAIGISNSGVKMSYANDRYFTFEASGNSVWKNKNSSIELNTDRFSMTSPSIIFSNDGKGGKLILNSDGFSLTDDVHAISMHSATTLGELARQWNADGSGIVFSNDISANRGIFTQKGTKGSAGVVGYSAWFTNILLGTTDNDAKDYALYADGKILTSSFIEAQDYIKSKSSITADAGFRTMSTLITDDWIWSKKYVSGPDFRFYDSGYFNPTDIIVREGSLLETLRGLREKIHDAQDAADAAQDAADKAKAAADDVKTLIPDVSGFAKTSDLENFKRKYNNHIHYYNTPKELAGGTSNAYLRGSDKV